MSAPQGRSRVVFVGNIPYDMSEEQLIDVFREVGTVVGFRLVFDRDTGKPKGYGFCEFEDAETAASAVRNLNDKELGGRPLRISYADVDPVFEGRTTTMGHVEGEDIMPGRGPGGGRGGRATMGRGGFTGANNQRQLPPNLPQGQALPPGMAATDAISQTLATLPPNQLLDILGQMKALVNTAPEQAKALLNGHPQLSYALFQAMLMMNVVDPNILQRILSSGAMGGTGMDMSNQGMPQGPPGGGTPMMGHLQQQQQQQGGYANTPPMGRAQPIYGGPPPSQGMMGMPMGGPPPMQQPQPGMGGVGNLPDDQRALLEQVMMLTQEQINALPPDQRDSIMQLKASLGQA